MSTPVTTNSRGLFRSTILLVTLIVIAAALVIWKSASARETAVASASHPEPMETVRAADATVKIHQPTTTAVGTVVALRSITLRNELSGTVRQVALTPGQIVDSGAVLVALDVAVEEAELMTRVSRTPAASTI